MTIKGIFYAIQKYETDQTIVQRYLTAKSDRDAVKASLIGVLLTVPVWTLFMFIGTGLFSFYELSSVTLPEGIKADAVFPHFILSQLPVGVAGLIISALIAAAISSLDSDINSLSAVMVQDFYAGLKKSATDHQKLVFGRWMVVASGIGALIVATIYVLMEGEGILGIIFTLYAIFSGGIAGMFLLGLFSKRANKKGLYTGIAASVIFTGWAVLTSTKVGSGGEERLILDLGSMNFTHHKYMLGVYSHVVLFVVGWLASLFFKAPALDGNLTCSGWKRIRNEQAKPKKGS